MLKLFIFLLNIIQKKYEDFRCFRLHLYRNSKRIFWVMHGHSILCTHRHFSFNISLVLLLISSNLSLAYCKCHWDERLSCVDSKLKRHNIFSKTVQREKMKKEKRLETAAFYRLLCLTKYFIILCTFIWMVYMRSKLNI